MNVVRLGRALRVLSLLSSDKQVRSAFEEDQVTEGQLYRFGPKQSRGLSLVLLHGVTARGVQDKRLVRLARVLAAEGVVVYVPNLSGLTEFSESIHDLSRIEEAIIFALRDPKTNGNGHVSILGFSLGGGYGLVGAAKRGLTDAIRRVTVVGGHHDLGSVWDNMSSTLKSIPARIEQATENELYFALGCAFPRLTEGQLGTAERETLRNTLWNYCEGVDLPSLRAFVKTELLPHWSTVAACHSTPTSEALSPAGKLAQVKGKVQLLHAPDDTLVPLYHAERNFEELKLRVGNSQVFFPTRLLDHVVPRTSESLREIPGLVRCFAELLHP